MNEKSYEKGRWCCYYKKWLHIALHYTNTTTICIIPQLITGITELQSNMISTFKFFMLMSWQKTKFLIDCEYVHRIQAIYMLFFYCNILLNQCTITINGAKESE